MLTQTGAQRAQTAARHVGGIGIHHLAHQIRVLTQLVDAARIGDRRADHRIAVTNQIFGASLNRNVDAVRQRVKQNTGRPGVVDHDDRLGRFSAYRCHNCRNILHFHRDRSRRLQEYNTGIGLHQFTDFTADAVIEPAGGNLQLSENFSTEVLRRFIDRAAHQYVVARLNKCQNRIRHRSRAAGIEHTACAAFQLGHRILQCKVRQGAATAIKKFAFCPTGGGAFFLRNRIKNQRRGALNDAVYRALGITLAASCTDERGINFSGGHESPLPLQTKPSRYHETASRVETQW